jgi:hypothetical protein
MKRRMVKNIALNLICFISMGLLIGCHPAKKVGGPFYFNRGSIQDSFKPNDEITLEQAKKLDSYNEVYFNDLGLVSKLTNFDHEKITYSSTYSYGPDGKMVTSDFKKYDPSGKMILEKTTP